MIICHSAFGAVAGSWDSVFAETGDASIFDSHFWQQIWWRHFGRGARLRIVEFNNGEFRGIAPLMQLGETVSFLGGNDLVDYHDFLLSHNNRGDFYKAVVGYLGADISISRIELLSIPSSSPTIELLPEIARSQSWTVNVTMEDVAPRLNLPDSWDAYLTLLNKKHRHELRRKLRRLESAGEAISGELSEATDVAACLPTFFSLMRRSSPEKAVFLTQEREAFFQSLIIELSQEGLAKLGYLDIDGQRVAASIYFVNRDVKLLYNSGYDPDFANLSVGLLNHAYNIRRSIEQGFSKFDFMRGGESYKYHLGATDVTLHKITMIRNSVE